MPKKARPVTQTGATEVVCILTALSNSPHIAGAKQLRKAIRAGTVERVYLAKDADDRVTAPLEELCRQTGTLISWIPSMRELGKACGIGVGAACAGILCEDETPEA